MRLLGELEGPWGVPSVCAYAKACSRVGMEGSGYHTFSPLVVSSLHMEWYFKHKMLALFPEGSFGKTTLLHSCMKDDFNLLGPKHLT